jgi:hypothetical protein
VRGGEDEDTGDDEDEADNEAGEDDAVDAALVPAEVTPDVTLLAEDDRGALVAEAEDPRLADAACDEGRDALLLAADDAAPSELLPPLLLLPPPVDGAHTPSTHASPRRHWEALLQTVRHSPSCSTCVLGHGDGWQPSPTPKAIINPIHGLVFIERHPSSLPGPFSAARLCGMVRPLLGPGRRT